MSPPLATVIVPVRNGERGLPALLSALEGQTATRTSYEVLVIDDASTDASAQIAAASPVARVLRQATRGGPYVARNRGLREARGRFLAFTDGDCRPAPDWIERGIAALADTEIAAGRVEMPLGENPTLAELLDCAQNLDQENYVAVEGFGVTANLWVRREVFDRVGTFNENFTRGGDTDFGKRATAAGVSLAYRRDVAVTHPPRHTAREVAAKAWTMGFGWAQRRRYAGPGSQKDHQMLICLRPRPYLPKLDLYRRERMVEAGHPPGGRRLLALLAGQYLWCRLPLVFGNLVGAIRIVLPGRLAEAMRSPTKA